MAQTTENRDTLLYVHEITGADSAVQSLDDTVNRFDINPTHSLKQQNREQHEQNETVYEVCWFVEKDEQQRIVARYRSWCNQNRQPPYRSQVGWERYTPDGTLLEREVVHGKLDDTAIVH